MQVFAQIREEMAPAVPGEPPQLCGRKTASLCPCSSLQRGGLLVLDRFVIEQRDRNVEIVIGLVLRIGLVLHHLERALHVRRGGVFIAPNAARCCKRKATACRRWAHQSMRAPEIFTTRAILAKSARSSALNASGLSGRGSMPCPASRSRISGSLSSVAIAALSWSTSAFGMPAGPSRPSQESNS